MRSEEIRTSWGLPEKPTVGSWTGAAIPLHAPRVSATTKVTTGAASGSGGPGMTLVAGVPQWSASRGTTSPRIRRSELVLLAGLVDLGNFNKSRP